MAGNSAGAALVNNYLTRKRMTTSPTDFRVILPICSALETQSHRNALLLCAKAIKKEPENYMILAFKALALSQSPRPLAPATITEIMSTFTFIMSNANGAGLNDPDVLLFFAHVLASIGENQEITTMYGKATSLFPTNEDVCVEAFLHYSRVGERKLAQQISMKMQRNFKSTRYLWWSIMSVVLQVREDLVNPTNVILLSLAERQISEHYSQLQIVAGINETQPTSNGKKVVTEGVESSDVEVIAKLDKGKGKATTSNGRSESITTNESLTPSITFANAHEFHLVTRFLELRILTAEAREIASSSSSSSPVSSVKPLNLPSQSLVLPSIITSIDTPQSNKEVLLAHFASKEGDKWCESGLGLEIWRREVELKHGSLEGGDWKKSLNRLKKSLEKGDSNWHTMLYFIRCSFALAAGSSSSFYGDKELKKPQALPSEEGKALLDESRLLFRTFADDGLKGKKERGYLLGLLEISRESRRRDWDEANSIPNLIVEYFERFSSKMCCFDDLKPYLSVLTEAERLNLVEKMSKDVIKNTSAVHVQKSISQAKVIRFISTISTEDSENTGAENSLSKYFEALPLGKGLPVTELQPADDFALLAAESFVAAWHHSHERKYLEKAAAVLQLAAGRSKYKYQLRILLINILRLLGASTLALTNYNFLDIKAIQFDTLSHLIMNRASTFSLAQSGPNISGGIMEAGHAALKWYKTGLHESREMPVRAFSYSNFTMIEDFIVFQERLTKSLSKDILIIEQLRMKVLAGTLESKIELSTLISNINSKFSDNRDFKTLPNFQPQSQAGIWSQVSMGPIIKSNWLKSFVIIYSNFLLPTTESIEIEANGNSTDLTESESALLALSKTVRKSLTAAFDDASNDGVALEFFKAQEARFIKAVEDTTSLPWEILHIAEINFEASCLLGLAVEETTAQLTAKKSAEATKQAKRLKSLKSAVDTLVRQLNSKVTAHGKKVGKERSKIMLGLNGLEKFPLMDEDILLNFAHSLTDSRKTMAEGLASAIHRRMK